MQDWNKTPLVTIITPVYNVEKYLDRCVVSIINQTYTNWELILINDGSTDHSPSMCDSWSEKDPRIRVFHKPNGGVSDARNRGIEVARGKYISFVDADDWVMPSFIVHACSYLEKEGIDYYQTTFQMVYSTDDKGTSVENPTVIVETPQSLARSNSFNICIGGGFYKKSIIDCKNLRFLKGIALAEDQIFNYSYFSYCNRLVVDNRDYCYFHNPTSATKSASAESLLKSIEALKDSLNENTIFTNRIKMTILSQMNYFFRKSNTSSEKAQVFKIIDGVKFPLIYCLKKNKNKSEKLLLILLKINKELAYRIFRLIILK